MRLYGIIIFIAMAVIATLNSFFNPMGLPWYHYVIATIIYTVAVILVDGAVAGISRGLPEKWIRQESRFYTATKEEQLFYRKLGVQKWKDHVPELGQFTGFHKNKVLDPKDNKYIGRFMSEVCYGILGHFWSMPLSFLILFIDWRMWLGQSNLWLTIGVPVAVVSVVLNFMPYVVLRYNLPKLQALYKINLRTIANKTV